MLLAAKRSAMFIIMRLYLFQHTKYLKYSPQKMASVFKVNNTPFQFSVIVLPAVVWWDVGGTCCIVYGGVLCVLRM